VHLARKGLTAAAVIANFHRQRVIPLTERSLPIFSLTPGVPASSSRTSTVLLPRGIAARRARNAVAEFPDDANDLWEIKMRPEPGYISVVSLNFNPLSICAIPFPFLLPDSDLTAFCRGVGESFSHQLHRPFGNSTLCFPVADYLSQRERRDHGDGMGLEVVA